MELACGEPLFSGQTEHDQMCRICDVLGVPPATFLELGPSERLEKMFVKVGNMEYKIGTKERGNPARSEPDGTSRIEYQKFADLVAKMLRYDPRERITPAAALQHPFLTPSVDKFVNTNLTQSHRTDEGEQLHTAKHHGGMIGSKLAGGKR
ncbi:Dual specificity tyrosine-phosphorylation-regulated kinase 1B [Irineochytrium annulatum]|nr:Dual specificity tyrosine-phosphorylation-regulated kinase 1B [Irineochytrium annulatum]